MTAIASLANHDGDRVELASAIQTDDRDDTPAALDKAWEDAPVTFNDAAGMSAEMRLHNRGSPEPGRTSVGYGGG
jgi:hypothetical protein